MTATQRPLEGIRVLEVAQMYMVPSAAAILSDWGAEVIKVEHPVTGDAQRGLTRVLGAEATRPGSSFAPAVDGANRGKRSIGLALDAPASRPILEELVRTSDVYLTNFLPDACRRLAIEPEDIHRINPDIIYASGSGFGPVGPEAGKPGYDATAFWARGASADGTTAADASYPTFMPSGAYGDSMGGLAIAAGVAAALFGRERTHQPSVLDVSLLAVGAWVTQFQVNLALFNGGPLPKRDPKKVLVGNPLVYCYRTADGRWIQLSMLQPVRYWADFCHHLGRGDLLDDPRFADPSAVENHYEAAVAAITETIGEQPLSHWAHRFSTMEGAWAVIQDAWELGNDESLRANGRISAIVDAEGHPQSLVVNPVRFGDEPVKTSRGPAWAEHTDEVLRELGLDEEQIINLKIAGAVT